MNFFNFESIRQIVKKFKSFIISDSIFTSCLLLIVGFIGFFCGQLSVITANDSLEAERILLCPQIIEPTQLLPVSRAMPLTTTQTSSNISGVPIYVASKNSTKFHHVDCPGAKQIKEDNKLFFYTIEEAERAGYTKAANCNQ